MLLFIQKAEKCHTAVPLGCLFLFLPPHPAVCHLFLLVAPPGQGSGTAEKESGKETRETQSPKASR